MREDRVYEGIITMYYNGAVENQELYAGRSREVAMYVDGFRDLGLSGKTITRLNGSIDVEIRGKIKETRVYITGTLTPLPL